MIILFTRINNLDIPIDLQLERFDHTVFPILTYAWGYENLEIIEKVHNEFLRKITIAWKSTHTQITIKSRVVGFWNRLSHGKERKFSLFMC